MVDTSVPKALRKYWKWKYATLLTSLLVSFLLFPFLDVSLSASPPFRMAELTIMFFCVLATARNRHLMMIATGLVIGGLLWPEGRHFCQIFFFLIVAVVVLIDVMQPEEVSADKILGAICGYLLVGITFAILYSAALIYNPHCFRPEDSDFQTLLYFSVVTLSTLGYGDIIPLTGEVRAMAALEAVIGQFYIAVIVARLVSLHIVEATQKARIDAAEAKTNLESPPGEPSR